ncbi:DNA primase [Candidatus Endolissoclinum faulkneri L2]|uniref:DNA primase n=1 Tax=Candidatus Endolissoclinum faulkneri L2 TaxID=1193729 RepID=K7YIX1_9PROT|nr:DNA primase [Candidatus Endolissoclinum faulkneri]AFX99570.1 DNA primase [Candidatus Endolissoclinum faulkneri L2]
MSLPPHFIEELRNRLTISSIISRKCKLKRNGREFIALCPFHNDNKPSLSVVDDKGFYHCFACGAHGDIFKFLMETNGIKFMEAVEQLASIAGICIPNSRSESRHHIERRKSIQSIMDIACSWYEQQLHTNAGEAGRNYLMKRGITNETIKNFRIGWAPGYRNALQHVMKYEGVKNEILIEAGLVKHYKEKKNSSLMVDYMRNRIVFPIIDRHCNVIAFGGRVLGDNQPKYLNSPETHLFNKAQMLYGISQARNLISKFGKIIVTEGYLDVLSLNQAGLPAVSPLGNTLSKYQLIDLWQITAEPFICFDGDKAGYRAALRVCDRALPLLKPGQSLRFVTLPHGQDPADLIRLYGKEVLHEFLAAARGLAEFIWDNELFLSDLQTPESKAKFKQDIDLKINNISDKYIRCEYHNFFRKKNSELFDNVDCQYHDIQKSTKELYSRSTKKYMHNHSISGKNHSLNQRIFNKKNHKKLLINKSFKSRKDFTVSSSEIRREQLIISIIAAHPSLLDRFGECIEYENFIDPIHENARHAIFSFVRNYPEAAFESLKFFLKVNFTNKIIVSKNVKKIFPFCDQNYNAEFAGKALFVLLMKNKIKKIEQKIDSLIKKNSQDINNNTLEIIMSLRATRINLINNIHAVDHDEIGTIDTIGI